MKSLGTMALIGLLWTAGMSMPAHGDAIVFSTQSSDSTPIDVLDAVVEYSFNDATDVLTLQIFNNTVSPSSYTISNLLFNVSSDVTGLSLLTKGGFPGATLAVNQSAGPFGTFDYRLDFGSGNTGITGGNSATVTFSVVGNDLSNGDFFSGLSVVNGQGKEGAVAAIHFTRGPGDDSAWATGGPQEVVPEPATLSLIGLGLAGLAVRRLRRRD